MKPEKIDTILGETATLDINNPGNHPDNPNSKLPKALVQLYRDIYGEDPYPNDCKYTFNAFCNELKNYF